MNNLKIPANLIIIGPRNNLVNFINNLFVFDNVFYENFFEMCLNKGCTIKIPKTPFCIKLDPRMNLIKMTIHNAEFYHEAKHIIHYKDWCFAIPGMQQKLFHTFKTI